MTDKYRPPRIRRSGRQLPAGFRTVALLAAALLLLVAPAVTMAETGTLTGKADRRGFLGVLVCLDLNRDQQCGPDEPLAIPDEDGNFTLVTDSEPGPDDVLLLELSGRYEGIRYEAQHVILAAPAEPEPRFSVFGTAELARAATPDAPGFPPETQAALEDEAFEALARLNVELARRERSHGSHSPTATEAAALIVSALGRYLDGAGNLNPLVTTRSVASDALARSGSTAPACLPSEPAVIHLSTDGSRPIMTRADYVAGAAQLQPPGAATAGPPLAARLRGRGNSTWLSAPKKPYRLKLDTATSLLGMPAGRNWALLANYFDRSMLRNSVGFCLSEMLGLPYTPQDRFAELTLNGSYRGLYQLTNKVYEITDLLKAATPPTEGGPGLFLIELDERAPSGSREYFITGSGVPWKVRYRSGTDGDQLQEMKAWLDTIEETILAAGEYGRLGRLPERVDLESLADYFLVQEALKNEDGFWSSTYAWHSGDDRLTFGPVWDFDLAAGNYVGHESPEGWLVRDQEHALYVRELLEVPEFSALLRSRAELLAETEKQLTDFVSAHGALLADAQEPNFERWPVLDRPVFKSPRAPGSYHAEVEHLEGWLRDRIRWLAAELR